MNYLKDNSHSGAKYFINYISLFKDLTYLPIEIRILIWKYVITKQYLRCKICDTVLLELLINNTNNNLILSTYNYTAKSTDKQCVRCTKYR